MAPILNRIESRILEAILEKLPTETRKLCSSAHSGVGLKILAVFKKLERTGGDSFPKLLHTAAGEGEKEIQALHDALAHEVLDTDIADARPAAEKLRAAYETRIANAMESAGDYPASPFSNTPRLSKEFYAANDRRILAEALEKQRKLPTEAFAIEAICGDIRDAIMKTVRTFRRSTTYLPIL